MNTEELLLEQYKMYSEHKERFCDRSFKTNKFYLLLVLGLILVMYLTKDYTFVFGLSSVLVFSVVGIAVCFLWWVNVDSYNFLIKVKLGKVLEEMEKRLPAQPYKDEFTEIRELRQKKREFIFADMQKVIATGIGLLFFVLAIGEIVAIVLG